jgi:hypothetical protein
VALVVEPGTGENAAANTYADVAYVDAYHTARGNTSWTGSTATKEAAIIRAMDWIEARPWLGTKRLPLTQPLMWPRLDVVVDDVEVLTIPEAVKRALAEMAMRAISTELDADVTAENIGQIAQSVAAGSVSVSFATVDAKRLENGPVYLRAMNHLRPYMRGALVGVAERG